MAGTRWNTWARIGALLALSVAAAVLAAAPASGRTSGGQAWSDPGGDTNGGPDIRNVAVSDSGGILTFRLTVSGMKVTPDSAFTAVETYVGLDTDLDGKSNYYLDVFSDKNGTSWDVEDANQKMVPQSRTMSFFGSGDSFTFRLASADLGGATEFALYVRSSTRDATGTWSDDDYAPDSGAWTYRLTSVKPVIGSPVSSPVSPLAGHSLRLTFPVTRSDSGARLTTGTVTAQLSVGGRAVAHTQQFKNGTISLQLVLPATAKGRTLLVHLSFESASNSATKSYVVPIA
jgi:hypothetical protein